MRPHKRNPAPRAAGRASDTFCLAAERSEDSRTLLDFQALAVTRRSGVPPATALALAPLVFGEARR